MIAVAPLSQSGVRRNKDSLSIFNFTRKFFINSARRTGPLGQWPPPRWATSLSAQRVQPAKLLLSRSLLTLYTCGQVLFSSLSLVFCWLLILHGRDDLWPTFSFSCVLILDHTIQKFSKLQGRSDEFGVPCVSLLWGPLLAEIKIWSLKTYSLYYM